VRQGRMTNASMSLQELRRKIYIKAKAEKHWKFWRGNRVRSFFLILLLFC
jgi:hypothetical protein